MDRSYDLVLALAGVALLVTALALRTLNRLDFPKFFVYFPVGVAAGPHALALAPSDPHDAMLLLERVAEMAVIISLVVAGLKIRRPLRWRSWRSTMRLILLVMPLSILAIAATGHLALGLALGPALLLGAILAPTDPVVAGAVQIERPTEDDEVRFGLTSEAGLNDGLAFPFVFLGLYLTLRADELPGLLVYWTLKDVGYAIALGLVAGWLLGHVAGRWFVRRAEEEAVSEQRRELIPLALLLVAYGVVELLGGWGFLSAFASGLGFRRALGEQHEQLRPFTAVTSVLEAVAEAASVILLGALFPWGAILGLGLGGAALAAATLLLVRPVVVWASTLGGGFAPRDRLYWAWFGIRGIGTLYYLAYAANHGVDDALARTLFAACALVVILSNVVHGVTAYPAVRKLGGRWLVQP